MPIGCRMSDEPLNMLSGQWVIEHPFRSRYAVCNIHTADTILLQTPYSLQKMYLPVNGKDN